MVTGDDQFEKINDQVHDEELVEADDAIIGKAFTWSIVVMAGIAVIGFGIYWLTRPTVENEGPTEVTVVAPKQVETIVAPPAVTFTDITQSCGIDFVHENGATGDKLLPETMGSGVAFIDYDNDGDQDLFFVNGTGWPWDDNRRVGRLKMYRNDGKGTFDDVSEQVGITQEIYGTGVAVGDLDGDRWNEIFVAGVGKNLLLKNNKGVFADITDEAGVAGKDTDWSSAPAFFDYDNDGDLDLYVGNYVQWSRDIDFEVDYRLVGGERSYGPPMNFQGTFPYLYRNDAGTFVDVTQKAGLQVANPATDAPMGKALAVMPIDADDDGYIDLLVA
ncbi:MAG: FG-GAP repeat domain-containing protein, partial [Phycisphaerae bacterium]